MKTNGGGCTCPRSNHWVLPTAASFGWTDVAAAANPLRYADRSQVHRMILSALLFIPIATSSFSETPRASENKAVAEAIQVISACAHWGGEVGDQTPERNHQIEAGVARDCPKAEREAARISNLYPNNAELSFALLELNSSGHFKLLTSEKSRLCGISMNSLKQKTNKTANAESRRKKYLIEGLCPEQAKGLSGAQK